MQNEHYGLPVAKPAGQLSMVHTAQEHELQTVACAASKRLVSIQPTQLSPYRWPEMSLL
jgi:hypothetical protein